MHQRLPDPYNLAQDRRLADLHHQLRSVLAAASLSLETTQLPGRTAAESPAVARSIDRALVSLQEAMRIAEEIRSTEISTFGNAPRKS